MYTERFTEVHKLLVHEPADSLSAAVHTSSYVSLANYHRAFLALSVGDIAAAGTVDCALLQATDTSGTSSKAITGKSITQLTQAGGDGDDALGIELQTEELDVDNGFDCIAVQLTLGTNTAEVAYMLFGIVPRLAPVGTTEWTEVVT